MDNVFEFFVKANSLMPQYPRYIFWGGIIAVMIVTQIVKLPIKYFTNKITNENLRKKVNTIIMLLPTGFSFLAVWVVSLFGFGFYVEAGVVWGFFSQVIYEFIKRLFAHIKKGGDITSETVQNALQEAVSVTTETQATVTEVKETAEDKFKRLVANYTNKNK